jgi:hypothetical protein
VPTAALQAGAIPEINPIAVKLRAAAQTQYPLSAPAVDISSYVSQAAVVASYNQYLYFQKTDSVPDYDPILMNSNTWADGILLASGMTQIKLNNVITALKDAALLETTGSGRGDVVEPCFTVWSIIGGFSLDQRVGNVAVPPQCAPD